MKIASTAADAAVDAPKIRRNSRCHAIWYTSAQLTVHYRPDQLIGRQVCAVVNFPPRQIGPFISEVLTLGMPDEDGAVVLVKPDFKVPNGGRLF